jgi:4-hydroxyphenylpyruvate dioxygenase-like putative hemolysin
LNFNYFHSDSTDQITTFISQHQNQAGLQHIGFFCMKNIKEVVRITKTNGAQFLSPCLNYYFKENNGLVIEAAGEIVSDLAELGILLDDETGNSDQTNKK